MTDDPTPDTDEAPSAVTPVAVAQLISARFRVLPLVPSTKQPAIKGWATPTFTGLGRDELEDWFPGHSVGIVTGVNPDNGSAFFVVDIDIKNGAPGMVNWKNYCAAKQWDWDNPPNAFARVKTPSGGRHYYYRYDPTGGAVRNSKVLGEGIDIRGEGGMVACPPTPNYEWIGVTA